MLQNVPGLSDMMIDNRRIQDATALNLVLRPVLVLTRQFIYGAWCQFGSTVGGSFHLKLRLYIKNTMYKNRFHTRRWQLWMRLHLVLPSEVSRMIIVEALPVFLW